jgi:chromosome segregation ATPase
MSQLIADHSNAMGELKVLLHEAESVLQQKNGAEAKMEERMEQMQAEIEGLKKELDGARKKAEVVSKGDMELEGKLKDALKELAGVRDELEGTQEVSWMSRVCERT